MTVIMTAKHQVTIPKKITSVLGLEEGALFDVEISKNRIELIPLEATERVFTKAEYAKLEALTAKERGRERKVSKTFIDSLKKGMA